MLTMTKQAVFDEDLPHADCLSPALLVEAVGTHGAVVAAVRGRGVRIRHLLLLAQQPVHQFRPHQVLKAKEAFAQQITLV